MTALFQKYTDVLERMDPIKEIGTVREVKGLLVESHGPQVVVGELCQILTSGGEPVWAEVVGFRDRTVQLMPFESMDGIEPGSQVVAMGETLSVPVSEKMLGRVLDAMGRPIDGKGPVGGAESVSTVNTPPNVLTRKPIKRQMVTGVRAIDTMTPIGKGQRIGIFSGSGVGKSTLLGMIARNTSADINVIALIGERGREVQEFIEYDLGPEGLERSILVVSTGDTAPLSRLRGAFVATTIAEHFRDKGADVMLLFDSVTRFARAQREIGLAVGEPPATRGYTPSVFSTLPKLLERCGTGERGTITGFYTILVEGDDMDEPVADAVRGILDGHIVLSRKLAQAYRYPAIDVLASLSRLGTKITSPLVQKASGKLRSLLAVYTDAEDLINVGAYAEGSNSAIDEAIEKIDAIREFLGQGITEAAPIRETIARMGAIAGIPIPEEELDAYETVSIRA
ncbi:FliI/YscN family ATPase [Sediminispirochaeta smaragdinae]|jgi:flagellum-specific ATP synthase|uniref:Flagellar protein export ATPase FliI n=1 Tax=Sediminispirochaeta smaragdinae (strain DSM 11293 / JCM 15392 / SEBR 4228) TaxID=573413 RepID=E1R5S7_SEDSS|nr:FliI/YscN family ATPase [Sediminispirochaeta smaragdinae]ADK80692.1 flagellar protein export ATPase FliI [Sediminispirochaeta smaragdinae DSM 11293]